MAKEPSASDTALSPEAVAAVQRLQDLTEQAGKRLSFAETVMLAANTCAVQATQALTGSIPE